MPAADTATPPPAAYPNMAFVDRLLELPAVTKTLETVSSVYTTYGRESTSDIVKSAVSVVDTTATTLAGAALPYLDAHKDTIAKVDSVACRGLDAVESRVERTTEYVASIQRQKDDVVNAVVNAYADPKGHLSTVVHSASEHVSSAKAQTTQTIQDRVADASNSTLDLIEATIDCFLPAAEEQKEESTITAPEDVASDAASGSAWNPGVEVSKVINRARQLVSRTRARAFSRAMTQVNFAKVRSQDTVNALRARATDLLEYAAKLDAEDVCESDTVSWKPVVPGVPQETTNKAARLAAKAVLTTRDTLVTTATTVSATVATTKEATADVVSAAAGAASDTTARVRALIDLAIQHATDLRDADNRAAFVAADFAAVVDRTHTVTAHAVLAFEGAVRRAKDFRDADDRFAFVASEVSTMKSFLRDMLWPSSPSELAPSAEQASSADPTEVEAQERPESPVQPTDAWREVEPESLPASPAVSMNSSFDSMAGYPRSIFERE